ncbi:MAG: hypothetical protein K6F09_07005 [Clostridiales bacterium]|nr:hypothetical protein [Clostridiales bacterium]
MKILFVAEEKSDAEVINCLKKRLDGMGADTEAVGYGQMRFLKGRLKRTMYSAVVVFGIKSASYLSRFRRNAGCKFLLVMICRGYECEKGTADSGCDLYVIPSDESMLGFVSDGIRENKLLPFGIPLDVSEDLDGDIRSRLGLSRDGTVILYILSETPLKTVKKTLAASNALFGKDCGHLVVCDNKRDEKRLASYFSPHKNIYVERLSEDAELYMKCADIAFLNPDGVYMTLASRMSLPFVIIGGRKNECRGNALFFQKGGWPFSGKAFLTVCRTRTGFAG